MGTLNQNGYESSSYTTKRGELVAVFKDAFGNTTDPAKTTGGYVLGLKAYGE